MDRARRAAATGAQARIGEQPLSVAVADHASDPPAAGAARPQGLAQGGRHRQEDRESLLMRARLSTGLCSCDACGRKVKIKARSTWSAAGALKGRGWVVFGSSSALCPT